jgi:teichuronic acid biosynthesis glycosyltransferase TuaH
MTHFKSHAFLILAANTPWVYALAHSLEKHGPVTALRLYDWLNYARLRPQWPETESQVRRVLVQMPPGYAGKLELGFRPLMRRIIDSERLRLRQDSGVDPVVVCPYPFLSPWVRHISTERLVYYNLDDYVMYDPSRASRIRALENELVQRAGLTACLSLYQVEALRKRHPAREKSIHHFPLGVLEEFLNSAPEQTQLPNTIGYIGNMTDRVDWAFVARTAELMPETSFHFIGDTADDGPRGDTSNWSGQRARALALSNVIHEGPVAQSEVPEHYRKYALNWMPYNVQHPFNIASCPTKIMDALASGRPFVSTDIPEVRLYPRHVHVVSDPPQAMLKLRAILNGDAAHDAQSQISFVRMQTWTHRAARFLELLASQNASGVEALERSEQSLDSIDGSSMEIRKGV